MLPLDKMLKAMRNDFYNPPSDKIYLTSLERIHLADYVFNTFMYLLPRAKRYGAIDYDWLFDDPA